MLGFSAEKTIQAAACLLKRAPGRRSNYMKLLKLLYIADRTSLQRRGAPICGDTPFAMERGPVPSATLDMIKGNDPQSTRWDDFITRVDHDVELTDDPGNLELSRAELTILNEIAERFRALDEWDMVRWCHEKLPEFQKNDPVPQGKKRLPIPLPDVLEAIGRKGDQAEITERINESAKLRSLFADHSPIHGE